MALQTEVVDLLVHCQQRHEWVRWIPVESPSPYDRLNAIAVVSWAGRMRGCSWVDTSVIGFKCITAETRYGDDECWTEGTMADVSHP